MLCALTMGGQDFRRASAMTVRMIASPADTGDARCRVRRIFAPRVESSSASLARQPTLRTSRGIQSSPRAGPCETSSSLIQSLVSEPSPAALSLVIAEILLTNWRRSIRRHREAHVIITSIFKGMSPWIGAIGAGIRLRTRSSGTRSSETSGPTMSRLTAVNTRFSEAILQAAPIIAGS